MGVLTQDSLKVGPLFSYEVTAPCSAVIAGSTCSNTNPFSVPASVGGVPGEAELTFIVIVDDPIPANVVSIGNVVTVPNECPNTGGSTNDCEEIVETQPGVLVSKSVDAGADNIASAGETLVYSITFTNTGGAPENYAVGDIGETVPINTTHAGGDDFTCSSVTAGSTCTNTNPLVVPASAGGIPGQVVLTFRVTVDDPIPDDVLNIANTVIVPSECPNAGGSGNDCEEVVETQPAISVTKSVDAGPDGIASPGESLTYTIALTNRGGSVQNYSAGEIGETVPANTTHAGGDDFTCAALTAGSACSNTNPLIIPASSAGVPGQLVLIFEVIVNDPIPANVTSIANTVTVPGECPNLGGNTNDCEEVVETQPNISVVKSVDAGPDGIATAGETLIYSITFSNVGGTDLVYAPGEIGEVVPVATTHTGSDDFTCVDPSATSACSNTNSVVVPALGGGMPGEVVLSFVVVVDDPIPENIANIINVVTVPNQCPNTASSNNVCDVTVIVPQEPRTVNTLGYLSMAIMILFMLLLGAGYQRRFE